MSTPARRERAIALHRRRSKGSVYRQPPIDERYLAGSAMERKCRELQGILWLCEWGQTFFEELAERLDLAERLELVHRLQDKDFALRGAQMMSQCRDDLARCLKDLYSERTTDAEDEA